MKFLSNAHTHTDWCDGKSSALDILAAAKKLGFVSLGFSDHANQGFDELYSMPDGTQDQYRNQLRALRQELWMKKQSPRLWVGLELDALADGACKRDAYERFDYVLGCAHYLTRDAQGGYVAVDGPPETLQRYVNEAFDGDGLAMARAYFDIHVDALLRDKPAVIGHFDLVRKHAGALNLFDPNGSAYRKLALSALERARACGGVLEINTGSMARGFLDTPYPTLELVGAWRELGGEVTVTSDCHDARLLDFGLEIALELAKKAGYRQALRLGQGEALWEAVPIESA